MGGRARPASFDSASAMAKAVGRFLDGKDFPLFGMRFGRLLRPLAVAVSKLPEPGRRWLYRAGSGREGLPAEVVARADEEQLARWVLGHYPGGRFPGALVGSTPGSAVHLAAALGMPLLPQTLLLPLAHHDVGIDDLQAQIATVRPTAEHLAAANPHLVVHHMADPMNDRQTLARFSYLRLKRTVLGPAYERFLLDHVTPGGVLYLVESGHKWPTTRLGERYVFQVGGVGGLEPRDYLEGGPRVSRFLSEQGAAVSRWEAPPPDGERPEAEWGFEPELAEDVVRFAERHGFRVVRIAFDHADDLSPAVAHLYRWWYRRLGWPADHLFVESFLLLDPYWVLRAGAVPYWVTFNSEQGVRRLCAYLDRTETYRWIEATLISNGTRTVDMAGPERWGPVFERAEDGGALAGVDERRFPTDLAVYARYRDTLRRTRPRRASASSLDPGEAEAVLAEAGGPHGVSVGELATGSRRAPASR